MNFSIVDSERPSMLSAFLLAACVSLPKDTVYQYINSIIDKASGGTVTSHGNSKSKAIKNGVIMGNPGKKTSKFKASAAGTTAYADGVSNGQIAYDQQALVGEVAPELLVRNGQAQLIGKRGAEFMNLKKGDVIFNHIDTAKLLSGDDDVRGKLIGGGFANGTTISASI